MKAKCPDCPEKDGRIKFLRAEVERLKERADEFRKSWHLALKLNNELRRAGKEEG